MASIDRRTREKVELQEKILNAARDLFLQHGFDAVTMKKIADAIDYTPGALYVHFKDKRDLMLALCRNDFAELDKQTHEMLRDEPDPINRIWKLGHGYLAFAAAHPNHYKLMFMTKHPEELTPDEEDLARMGNPDQDGYAMLIATVQEGIDKGCFRPELSDAELVSQTLWAALHGVAALQITHSNDPWCKMKPYEQRSVTMAASILRGLVRDPSVVDKLLSMTGEIPPGGSPG